MLQKYFNYKNLKNVGFIWLSSFLNVFFSFLNQTILARGLSVDNFGVFSSYMGLINLLLPIVGFGITSYWLKSYGENNYLTKDLILASLIIFLCSFTLIYFTVILTAEFHVFDNLLMFSFLSLIIIGTLFKEMIATIFQIKGSFIKFSVAESIMPFSRFILIFSVIYFFQNNSILIIAFIWGISSFISPLFFYRTAKKEIPNPIINYKRVVNLFKEEYILNIFKKSFIFGLTGILYLGWSQGHIVFAKYLFGNYAAGLYSSVIILCVAISMFPNVIFSKFLAPKFHSLIYENPLKLKSLFFKTNTYLFILGLLTTIVVYFSSDLIINLTFGQNYAEGIEILQIISFTFPMRFCGFNSGLILTTREYLPTKFIILLIIVFVNFLIAYFLSISLGLKALAISIVISEFILVIIYLYVTNIKLCTLTKNTL
jgi:O-antigen/teichoic acid export membrane protein